VRLTATHAPTAATVMVMGDTTSIRNQENNNADGVREQPPQIIFELDHNWRVPKEMIGRLSQEEAKRLLAKFG
jgi:hypothetical protein